MSVLLIGTLDTKATEVAFVRDRLREAGVPVLVADAGTFEPPFPADISAREVFAATGAKLEDVRRANDRGKAVELAARGAEQTAKRLHAEGKLSGVLGLGGSAGTTIATAAMRAVPVGVPKLMVSTLASGDVRPYVGTRDVCMMSSVVDVAGLNRVSRLVLTNAAAAMAGMVKSTRDTTARSAKVISATMFGVTTPCVTAARSQLEASGFEVLTFHATGTGGRTMEGLIGDGLVSGVLDITTTELADDLCGGVMSAGNDRLTAAAMKGVPQVISVGALDMVNFGPPETVPEKYHGRRFYQHNPTVTLMRTTPEENDQLGKQLAERACASGGPTAILLPLRGVSALDAEGKPFWWPEANFALFQSIRNWVYGVELIELDCHINDPQFAATATATLLRMLNPSTP
ncbi:MAG: Tm-1-like ATP-binding domain-containing protein [Fimbriiglobus sp.]|nr:Tm-1-like ATP-binding domain-containing protein [Fimbriiglobus sp.]